MIAIVMTGGKETASKFAVAATSFGPVGLNRVMMRVVAFGIRDLKVKGMTGRKGRHPLFGVTGAPASSGAVGVRTGFLRASVVGEVVTTASPPTSIGVMGTPSKLALIHEYGGEVRGHPYLRIPLAAMQTGAGVDRMAGAHIKGLIPGSFVWPTKRMTSQPARNPRTGRFQSTAYGNRNPLTGRYRTVRYAQMKNRYIAIAGRGGKLVLLYLLKKEVKLPARYIFARSLARIAPFVLKSFNEASAAIAQKAN